MPFDAAFDDVYVLAIKQAGEDAGAYVQRVDEQIFRETILQRVYDQIRAADLIVAEMSGRNPNVFYEVGYAHALEKTVILVTRVADDIPFDLKHYPHIVYHGRLAELRAQLSRHIAFWASQRASLRSRKPLEPKNSASSRSNASGGGRRKRTRPAAAKLAASNVSAEPAGTPHYVEAMSDSDFASTFDVLIQKIEHLGKQFEFTKDDEGISRLRTSCMAVDAELRHLESRARSLGPQAMELIAKLREKVVVLLDAARVSREPPTTFGI